LYVSTSGIYGSGDTYALNLVTRHAVMIPIDAPVTRDAQATYGTYLLRLDAATRILSVSVEDLDSSTEPARRVSVPLLACEN